MGYKEGPMLQYEELIGRLSRLDEDASYLDEKDERLHLVIVGGGALILQKIIVRATSDIDAISVSSGLTGLLAKHGINCRVNAYIDSFPYGYEDRLVKLPIRGKRIDFFSLSLEDLVVAKLHSNRDSDKADVEDERVRNQIDWELLERLALSKDEAEASALSERVHQEFLIAYRDYVQEFRP